VDSIGWLLLFHVRAQVCHLYALEASAGGNLCSKKPHTASICSAFLGDFTAQGLTGKYTQAELWEDMPAINTNNIECHQEQE